VSIKILKNYHWFVLNESTDYTGTVYIGTLRSMRTDRVRPENGIRNTMFVSGDRFFPFPEKTGQN
jgi:hypothetical protein